MKFPISTFILVLFGLVSAALADEDKQAQVSIAIAGHATGDATSLILDGDELGFDLHDMQEGENRSIVDKSGRNILVTREADGYVFDIDGKTIELPLFNEMNHGAVWVGGDGDYENMEVHVMSDMATPVSSAMDGVTIFSGKPIDEATQQAIRSMLQSAGHGSEVQFIDHENVSGGIHGVKVIEKRVELTQ